MTTTTADTLTSEWTQAIRRLRYGAWMFSIAPDPRQQGSTFHHLSCLCTTLAAVEGRCLEGRIKLPALVAGLDQQTAELRTAGRWRRPAFTRNRRWPSD